VPAQPVSVVSVGERVCEQDQPHTIGIEFGTRVNEVNNKGSVIPVGGGGTHIRTHACMHACMHVCMHAYIRMSIDMYTYMSIYVCVCMYVCIYIYIYYRYR